jgi:PadR family transcriptional regulator AphA
MARAEQIQLTPTSYVVLGMVDWLGPSTPYTLKKMLEVSVADFYRVPHTTMYSEPARLAAAGYLEESQEGEGRRRKRYSLTDKGRSALKEWLADPEVEPTEVRAPALLKVFFGADPAPLAEAGLEYHRELLEFFEGLREQKPPPMSEGAMRALETGIAYHRFWVEQWERLPER